MKLGLALGSGGAKGAALIGALKAFEEENIEFDVVAGASIGSIVGGLYAKGYTSRDMHEMIERYNVTDPQTLLMLKLSGVTVTQFLKKAFGDLRFDDLKKPMRAVAVDMYEGEEVVMGKGDLCEAMAASSAMPPVFKPVLREGKYLIDGAYLNYVPSDVVRILGAERVIGINLGSEHKTNVKGKKILDELYPENKVPLIDRSVKGYRYADIMLEPNLSAYRSVSVSETEAMYDVGYNTVKQKINEIMEILR